MTNDRDQPQAKRRSLRQRTDLLITLLGLLGLVLVIAFYDRAFPSAAIDLELSRAEIKQRAAQYLHDRGYELTGYKSAVTFSGSGWASLYLQRQLGIAETNRLIQENEVPIWFWRARWFRPLQKEGFRVYLAPDGKVVGLSHTVMEDAPGASLPQEEARELARDYLSEERGWDLAGWDPVSASSEERPGGRTDHSFAWKRRDWDVGDSQVRLTVRVQGDEIGYYDHWLKVPEAFQRDFSEKRNIAGFIDGLSTEISWALLALIVILALWKTRFQIHRSYRRALAPALFAGAVVLVAGLNQLPLAKAWYETTEKYGIFWLNQLYIVFYRAIFNVIYVFILWFVAHWISKRAWPRQDRILSRRGDRWHNLARSGWRGLMMGLISAGYVVLFYLVATRILGGWSPMSPDYTYAYATPLPFLGAVQSGVLPALHEELMFRLLLIAGIIWGLRTFLPLPETLTRVLALVIPGALWGFAHLSYVRDPLYLRGIELTIPAVLLYGLFFLRFDLTTTMVAHFAFNAGLGALPLLRSGEPYFVASGLVVIAAMLAPTMPHLIRELRRRRGERREAVHPRVRTVDDGDRTALSRLPLAGIPWEQTLDDSRTVVLCLQAGDEIVGVGVGRMNGEDTGEVNALYVAPAWRRRYWGSEMLTQLRDRLQARGAAAVETAVAVDNTPALRFMTDQDWRKAQITFRWPSRPPTLPWWDRLLEKLGLSREPEQKSTA